MSVQSSPGHDAQSLDTVLLNQWARPLKPKASTPKNGQLLAFHQCLPDYNETPLVSLPNLAKELGVGHVLVKDESRRFGLPAFKVLGASWAVYRAVLARCGLQVGTSMGVLGQSAKTRGIQLVTCTDGNWGRAVSRMAKYLEISAKIFVPKTMDQATRNNITCEGAEIVVIPGDYDASSLAAQEYAAASDALLVMDSSSRDYEEIPSWVVEGYSTMLFETDRQLSQLVGKQATCAIASVGVGSFAHAVTAHYKNKDPAASVVAVEPTTAACFRASLRAGEIVPIQTDDTIMCGMNCGTLSSLAWSVLKQGVDASVIVSDLDAHQAVQTMQAEGINAGPCGAAPLAALRHLRDGAFLDLNHESVVVLFCTEGTRPYVTPVNPKL